MSRYIDAGEARRFLLENAAHQLRIDHIAEARGLKYAADCLDGVMSADVAPVIYAHWIPKKEMIRSPDAKNYNCSACGKESFVYPNCPFCRAIMDGKENEK